MTLCRAWRALRPRNPYFRSSQSISTRVFSNSVHLTAAGHRERQSHPEGGIDSRQALNSGRQRRTKQFLSERNAQGSSRFGKGSNARDTYYESLQNSFDGRVIKQLAKLKNQLQEKEQQVKSENTKEQKPLLLSSYQKEWDGFETGVRDLISNPRSSEHSTELQTLYSKILDANRWKNAEENILILLHFSFIDFALAEGREVHTGITKATDLRYPSEWYVGARKLQRQVHLHVGPTNSGKTYNALKRLAESGDGLYAGPLRLLAYEVYSRFNNRGVSCDLVTGDDVRRSESDTARLTASTVEMVDINRQVEVAVIDEIQMLESDDRGWAWTRAVLGTWAKEVHLCGETRIVPLIRELVASTGDILHIHEYDRLNPLKVMSKSLKGDLRNLRKGDCIISFSVMGIHDLKKEIERITDRRVAIVYGSLPPETRAQQAALFNDPDSDYDFLVASDAVGMGLNLSIKRVIFETLTKSNGKFKEQLTVPQIKQIAGRAGRYKTARDDNVKTQKISDEKDGKHKQGNDNATVGLVTCLDELDLPIIQRALATEPAPIMKAGILPPANLVEEYAARLPVDVPFEYLIRRVCDEAVTHSRYKLCSIRDTVRIARAIESVDGLSIAQRYVITAAPGVMRDVTDVSIIKSLAACVAAAEPVTIIDIPEIPLEVLEEQPKAGRDYLRRLERLHKSLILYLWLSYRFIHVFQAQAMAFHAKELVEEKINTTLASFSSNPELRQRLEKLKTYKLDETLGAVEGTAVDAGVAVHSLEETEHEKDRFNVDGPIAAHA